MAFVSQSRPVADGVFGQAPGFSIFDMFGRIVAWNDRRQTRNVLSALSDRELNDIGLTRADIDDVANGLR